MDGGLRLLDYYTEQHGSDRQRSWLVFPWVVFCITATLLTALAVATTIPLFTVPFARLAGFAPVAFALFLAAAALLFTGYISFGHKAYRILMDADKRVVVARPVFWGPKVVGSFDDVDAHLGEPAEAEDANFFSLAGHEIVLMFRRGKSPGTCLYLDFPSARILLAKNLARGPAQMLLHDLRQFLGKPAAPSKISGELLGR